MSHEPITVLIAEDHPVDRDGWASLLEPVPDIAVVGRAAGGIHAVEQARDLSAAVVAARESGLARAAGGRP